MESRNSEEVDGLSSNTERVRVLYLMDCLYGDAGGGSERQFLSFYEKCDDFGIDPYVCFLRHAPVHNSIHWQTPPLTLALESILSPKLIMALRTISRYVKDHQIEIVQTLFDDASIVGALYSALYARGRPPLFIGLRNSGHEHQGPLRNALGLAYRQASHFIVNAQIVAQYLSGEFKVDPKSISVIRNMYLSSNTQPNESIDALYSKLRNRFTRVAVVVANLRPIKGLDDLLRAIALLKNDGIVFLFVGSGECEDDYKQMARDLDIQEQVRFLGRRDDVLPLLASADFGVLPSHAEGLSNSLIEYVMAGLPVIATQVGGNEEIVATGHNGLIVPPREPDLLASAIAELLSQYSRYKTAALEEQKRALGRYGTATIMEQYKHAYTTHQHGGIRY